MNSTPEPVTAPPVEPEGAVAALFSSGAEVARRYCGHLTTTAVARGLIGPREVPRIWERHLLNCAAMHELIPMDATVVDVGSGAGLPGVALAIARPDLRVLLVEPLQRRVSWLDEVVEDLGLTNVEVARARAEELSATVKADVVTARAVAGLPMLARLCLPLVRPGGRFMAVKGRSARGELDAGAAELARLGATAWEVRQCGEGVLDELTTVIEVTAGSVARGKGTQRRSSKRGSSRRR